jgi:hypothetical protein
VKLNTSSRPWRTKMKFHLFIWLLAISWPLQSWAQDIDSEEEEPLRVYDVEVVIFKNLRVPKSREYVLPVTSPSKEEVMFEIASADSSSTAAELGFEMLPSSEFRLVDQVARLVQSPRYELLAYVAWRQPGLDREQAIPVWISGGQVYGNEYTSIDDQYDFIETNRELAQGENTETEFEFDEQTLEALELKMLERQATMQHDGLYELEGKITVALSRYLHIYTDLVLRRPRRSADALANTASEDMFLATYSADTRILNNHSLKEHRRMRSKNLHYLDNPEFSMLILITPYEATEDTEAEDEPAGEVQ